MSATPATKRRDRRADILAATCRVVVSDGLDGLRSATVSAAAGTSAGLVHYHFPTLDDLALAAYLWDEERVWEPLAGVDATADPLGMLELLLVGQLTEPEADVRAGFMLWQEYARRAIVDDRIREVVVRRIERWVDVMTGLIRSAAEQGTYADAEAAATAAPLFAALLFGASALHLSGLVPIEVAANDMATQLAQRVTGTSRPAAAAPVPASSDAEVASVSSDAVLDATLAVVARGGVRAVHFADVAAEAGVSTALPRYYFATLHGLLAAAFARFTERRRARVRQLIASASDPRERVRFAVVGLAAMDSPQRRDELIIWHEFLRLGFIHDDVRPVVCAAAQSDIDELSMLLGAAGAADTRDPDATARQLVELVSGVGLGELLGILGADEAVRILDWAVADALSPGA
ncbi:MAG: TetR/AcrR family transcriptional regulator [Gaiellales bacterium]